MNVLTRSQRAFLAEFFARGQGRAFYLTGGGALAAFYLGHRVSQDLDLFTQRAVAWDVVRGDLEAAADAVGGKLDWLPDAEGDDLRRAFLTVPGEASLKIDLVRDAPPYFGEPQRQADGVMVDTLENIAVGKLLAVYGRAYPRDFVDLYFLLRHGLEWRRLLQMAKEKDPGLFESYLADMMRLVRKVEAEDLPPLSQPLDVNEMQRVILDLADDLERDKPSLE
jgi:hypothetical protein